MSNDKLAQALRALLHTPTARKQAWDALANYEAEKQAGPVTDEADMFWDGEDGERNSVEEIIADYYHGDVVKIDRAKRLPSITVRVVGDKGDYEVIDEPAKSSAPPSKSDKEELDLSTVRKALERNRSTVEPNTLCLSWVELDALYRIVGISKE